MATIKQQDGQVNARSQDKIRASIKVFEIVKALQDHILAGLKLTNTQVRAAEILMRKVSPDLLATAITDGTSTALPVLQIVRASPDTRPESAQDQPSSKVSTLAAAGSQPGPAQPSAPTDPGQKTEAILS